MAAALDAPGYRPEASNHTGVAMLYTPLERHVRTIYVPEDYIDRLAEWAATGKLIPGPPAVHTVLARRKPDYVRVSVLDRRAARELHFNTLEVWRVDGQTIQYRVSYRARRGERFRALWRSAPAPPFILIMLPVIAALAFLMPEFLLLPIFGFTVPDPALRRTLQPLGKRLKEIADTAA